MTCLRRLLNIKWKDKVPDTEVLSRANLPSIYTILQRYQVRWAGHVCRKPDARLPKQLLYMVNYHLEKDPQEVSGNGSKTVSRCLWKKLGICTDSWESLAQDRPSWRTTTNKGFKEAEVTRLEESMRKREVRKTGTASPSTAATEYMCPRYFHARIGLISHFGTHRTHSTT